MNTRHYGSTGTGARPTMDTTGPLGQARPIMDTGHYGSIGIG
jgi:hypothetical protein